MRSPLNRPTADTPLALWLHQHHHSARGQSGGGRIREQRGGKCPSAVSWCPHNATLVPLWTGFTKRGEAAGEETARSASDGKMIAVSTIDTLTRCRKSQKWRRAEIYGSWSPSVMGGRGRAAANILGITLDHYTAIITAK